MANASLPLEQSGVADVPRVVRMVMQIRGRRSADLAGVLHLNEGSMSKRLSGKIQFRVDELVTLAHYLDVDPGMFFRSPDEIIRSRCFASVAPIPGQMTLALGVDRPALAAV